MRLIFSISMAVTVVFEFSGLMLFEEYDSVCYVFEESVSGVVGVSWVDLGCEDCCCFDVLYHLGEVE